MFNYIQTVSKSKTSSGKSFFLVYMSEEYQLSNKNEMRGIYWKFIISLLMQAISLPLFFHYSSSKTDINCIFCNSYNFPGSNILFKLSPPVFAYLYFLPLVWIFSYLSVYFSDFIYLIRRLKSKINYELNEYILPLKSNSNRIGKLSDNNINGNHNNINGYLTINMKRKK